MRCTRLPAPGISFRSGGFLSRNGSAGTTGAEGGAADSACGSNGPPKGLTKGFWASSSRKAQAGALTHTAHPGAVYIPAVTRLSGGHQDFPWLSRSLFL